MPDVNLDRGALVEAVSIGQKLGTPQIGEKVHFALVPAGTEIKSLDRYQFPQGVPPDHIAATVSLRDAASFCKYYSTFADDRSRVFAEPTSKTFLAVLDYHGAGERKAEFLHHRVNFSMTLDDRWNIWAGKNEKVMNQVDFAEFLEDHNADISDPAGAVLLEVARDLKASSSGNFESKVVPKSGSIQMKYTENVDGKVGSGDIEVPEFFKISIPVFYGEQPITISARLRYRINGGSLTFFYKLYRQTEILNNAFNKAVASVADTLKCDVLLGSPA